MGFTGILKPKSAVSESIAPDSGQVTNLRHVLTAGENLTLAAMLTPKIEVVASFVVAIINRCNSYLVATSDRSFFEVHFAFTNDDLIAIRFDVEPVVSIFRDNNRRGRSSEGNLWHLLPLKPGDIEDRRTARHLNRY
jgi:hypothetical protein